MTYSNLLAITANSAIDTAAICYRKARRDVHRIHALLTHPRTVQAAKIAIWCLYLGAVVAFALGQTARILADHGAKAIQQWAEAEVQSCLATEGTALQPIIEAPQPVAQTAPAMAAPITEPVVSVTVRAESSTEAPADLATLKTAELRKLCSQRGITWRNALGANRHLPKAAMVAALAS